MARGKAGVFSHCLNHWTETAKSAAAGDEVGAGRGGKLEGKREAEGVKTVNTQKRRS